MMQSSRSFINTLPKKERPSERRPAFGMAVRRLTVLCPTICRLMRNNFSAAWWRRRWRCTGGRRSGHTPYEISFFALCVKSIFAIQKTNHQTKRLRFVKCARLEAAAAAGSELYGLVGYAVIEMKRMMFCEWHANCVLRFVGQPSLGTSTSLFNAWFHYSSQTHDNDDVAAAGSLHDKHSLKQSDFESLPAAKGCISRCSRSVGLFMAWNNMVVTQLDIRRPHYGRLSRPRRGGKAFYNFGQMTYQLRMHSFNPLP